MQRTFLAVVLTAMLLCAGCAAEQSQGQSSSNADISSGQEQQDSFDQLEQALTMYEPGAAGSSKKVYIAAAGILNYSMEYEDVYKRQGLYFGTMDTRLYCNACSGRAP